MSDILHTYAQHDDENIKGFFGYYRWLSNFHPCTVYFEGLKYPSSENAYQAAKLVVAEREKLTTCSPSASKRIWKQLRQGYANAEQWDEDKNRVMSEIVFNKFCQNKELLQSLLNTGEKYLEETNHWNDTWWGVDINKGGKNHLGRILMHIRTFWA